MHLYTARIPSQRYRFGGISLLMGSVTGWTIRDCRDIQTSWCASIVRSSLWLAASGTDMKDASTLCCRRVGIVLASEDRTQRGKRLGGTTEVGGNGLALHHGVGVSTETESKGKDFAVAWIYAMPHLSWRPQGKEVWDAGRRKHNGGRAWCGKGIIVLIWKILM